MSATWSFRAAVAAALIVGSSTAIADAIDGRLRDVTFDAATVVTVPVMRGIVTHILLDADEAIAEVAAGIGSDCAKPEATWCIAAQAGGRSIFVKPKSSATNSNNLAVVTDKRTHSFRFVVLADSDNATPVYRLAVHAPVPRRAPASTAVSPLPRLQLPVPVPPAQVVAERLKAAPELVNSSYSLSEGKASDDIVPVLIFDDGCFTYLRFPGNRQIPAVFDVLGDGSEGLANTRMEGDLLVVDRVSRRLMLRAGSAVVGIWNDDFDLEGKPPVAGASVAGVRRTIKFDEETDGRPQARTEVTP